MERFSLLLSPSHNPNQFESLAQSLGYQSVSDFTRIQLRHAVEQKITYYQSRIDYYQQKYGMNFEEFRRRVVDQRDAHLSSFGVIEKEDDDNNWEDAIDFLSDYSTALAQVRP